MAIAMMSWMLAIPLLGLTTGLRSMTPMAVLCWYAYFGYLPVDDTWAEWTQRLPVLILFTLLALWELVADKCSWIPNRTSTPSLLLRLVLGGLVGAIAATALAGSSIEGVVLGLLGAVLGTFAGFMVRRDLVEKIGCRDWHVAVAEDVFAIAAAAFALHVITG